MDKEYKRRDTDNLLGIIRLNWPIIVGLLFILATWFETKSTINNIMEKSDQRANKYIPILEMTEHRVTVLEERYRNIIDMQIRMEKKLDFLIKQE